MQGRDWNTLQEFKNPETQTVLKKKEYAVIHLNKEFQNIYLFIADSHKLTSQFTVLMQLKTN